MASELKIRIEVATREAMKAREALRLSTLRMLNAEIKQVIVDERRELGDADVLAILQRMIKQRRESERQYRDAGREDLAGREAAEIVILGAFMPTQLSSDELDRRIDAAVLSLEASGRAQIGPLMALLKAELAGQADMADVARRVKGRLSR